MDKHNRIQENERGDYERLSIDEMSTALRLIKTSWRATRREAHQGNITSEQIVDLNQHVATQGLRSVVRVPRKPHPWATPPEVVARILALSLAHPAWGPGPIRIQLKQEGISISDLTINKIRSKHGLSTKRDRLGTLDEQVAREASALSDEQLRYLAEINPCYREYHLKPVRPGALVVQDAFCIGTFERIGSVYLHAVVDMYSFAAFGLLHTARDSVAAALALHNEALPFFHKRELRIERILTDYGHEFCGSPTHPYELYLGVYSIKHERVRVHHQHVNGFMERFTQIAQDEFFTPSLHDVDRFPSLSVLQKEFARWMTNYNTERSHLGYPLGGQRPWEVIAAYLASRPAAS